MNKSELVAKISNDTRLNKRQASAAVGATLKNITRALQKGQRVTLVGFGTFYVNRRKARTGRNPQTGEPIKIPARRVPRFTAGTSLRSFVR
ncbi:MAG: HU family DNA-binding protein [Acidobacteria bacterium]|nr:HU family DNA-binding protein [Acidobacteriota bacterium]